MSFSAKSVGTWWADSRRVYKLTKDAQSSTLVGGGEKFPAADNRVLCKNHGTRVADVSRGLQGRVSIIDHPTGCVQS